jgi:hypothetical protein
MQVVAEPGQMDRFPIGDCLNVPNYPEFGYNDMIEMESLHIASILYNLRMRFNRDIIYTYMGGILISVNPFKFIDLYSAESVDAYMGRALHESAPHIYATADSIYRAILREEGNQAVVIRSGLHCALSSSTVTQLLTMSLVGNLERERPKPRRSSCNILQRRPCEILLFRRWTANRTFSQSMNESWLPIRSWKRSGMRKLSEIIIPVNGFFVYWREIA